MSDEAAKAATEADKAARGARLRAILDGALSTPENMQGLDHALGEAGFELDDQTVVMARAVVEQVKAGALSQRDAKELLDKMLLVQQAQTTAVAGTVGDTKIVAASNETDASVAIKTPDASLAMTSTQPKPGEEQVTLGAAVATKDGTGAAIGNVTASTQKQLVDEVLKRNGFKESAAVGKTVA